MSKDRPIKVLHIASGDRWAGAEMQLFTLLSHLRNAVDVAPHAILMNDGELAQRLRACSIPVDILDERTLSSRAILHRLMQSMREIRPDVVHTHRQKENILGAIANSLSIRARCLRTVHGAPEHLPLGIRQRIQNGADLWTGRHLQQAAIGVSSELTQTLLSQGIFKRVVTIENGIDIATVQRAAATAPTFELAANSTHVGIIGRLDPVKRVDIFLGMAAILLGTSTTQLWQFHIYGEGAQETHLKVLAERLGIAAKVKFHGHVNEVAAHIARLDAIVMCSDHEGLPMIVLEAIALGTPMLAHAVGGLRIVLENDCGGHLVRDHSPAGYAAGLQKLLDANVPTLLKNGMHRIRHSYTAELNCYKTLQLYRSMCQHATQHQRDTTLVHRPNAGDQ